MSPSPPGRMPAAWDNVVSEGRSGEYEWIPLRLPPADGAPRPDQPALQMDTH